MTYEEEAYRELQRDCDLFKVEYQDCYRAMHGVSPGESWEQLASNIPTDLSEASYDYLKKILDHMPDRLEKRLSMFSDGLSPETKERVILLIRQLEQLSTHRGNPGEFLERAMTALSVFGDYRE